MSNKVGFCVIASLMARNDATVFYVNQDLKTCKHAGFCIFPIDKTGTKLPLPHNHLKDFGTGCFYNV
jgi:hypothetical protein